MLNESGSAQFWFFTEHRNATFIINFELPLQTASKQFNIHHESWSSGEIANLGLDAITAILREKASSALPNVAIFSRYVIPHGQALITLCKSLGIVTFFHLDDLLQQLPADIGQKYASTYSDAYKAELDLCIRASDGVLVSTPILAEHIAKRYPEKKIRTVPGVCFVPVPGWSARGIQARLARFKCGLNTGGIQTLGYMGSVSHMRDLVTITPQIAKLMRTRPNLHFETLGLPVPSVLKAEFGERIRQFGFTSTYSAFLRSLYEVHWDLGLAPLVQDDFNRAKTVTKFIEYTACGIPTLAEPVEPYSGIGQDQIALVTNGDWVQAVNRLLSNEAVRHKQLICAQAYCQAHFTGEIVLKLMLAAIEQLTTLHNK